MDDTPAPPPGDRDAARARYRALMRGRFMRSMYVLLGLVLLVSWGLGVASVLAPDVERLPGHDFSVPPARCVACHAPTSGAPPAAGTPPMAHVALPTCGFCHRQGPPVARDP
jgi:hypothetical protein